MSVSAPEARKLGRFGYIVRNASGPGFFRPAKLRSDFSLHWDDELRFLLSGADRALGSLDGIASTLPNPDLFGALYVRNEALLSARIAGCRASLIDVLAAACGGETTSDVDAVVRCIAAMKAGIRALRTRPLSLGLLQTVQGQLVGIVHIPRTELADLMNNLEEFMRAKTNLLPLLVKSAVIHGQFEAIHPFMDGNGRMGRLLTTLLFINYRILHWPLLCLSRYFSEHPAEYHEGLHAIRVGAGWEQWIKFWLRGVHGASNQTIKGMRTLIKFQKTARARIEKHEKCLQLLEHLFATPLITIQNVRQLLDISYATAGRIVGRLEDACILSEVTGYRRNRRFLYLECIQLLRDSLDE